MLVEGVMISGDPWFLEKLRWLYGTGLDRKGCAIVQGARGEVINNSCEPVHNEICRALADLVTVYRRDRRPGFADQTKERALESGCPAGPLN